MNRMAKWIFIRFNKPLGGSLIQTLTVLSTFFVCVFGGVTVHVHDCTCVSSVYLIDTALLPTGYQLLCRFVDVGECYCRNMAYKCKPAAVN